MRAQRPADAAPAVSRSAEQLPLDDDAVDAAMACFTIHHWQSPRQGLAELQRVARGRVIVATLALDAMPAWQRDYLARGARGRTLAASRRSTRLRRACGGRVRVECIATPADCTDGFIEAFWGGRRRCWTRRSGAQSMWATGRPGDRGADRRPAR